MDSLYGASLLAVVTPSAAAADPAPPATKPAPVKSADIRAPAWGADLNSAYSRFQRRNASSLSWDTFKQPALVPADIVLARFVLNEAAQVSSTQLTQSLQLLIGYGAVTTTDLETVALKVLDLHYQDAEPVWLLMASHVLPKALARLKHPEAEPRNRTYQELTRLVQLETAIAGQVIKRANTSPLDRIAQAARVQIGHGALTNDDREAIARTYLARRNEDKRPLFQLIVDHGPQMLGPIVTITTDANKTEVAQLLKKLHKADFDVPDHLFRLGRDEGAWIHARQRALELVDLMTHGPDSLPLPPGAFDAWMLILMQDERHLSEPVVNALVRRPESGWKEEDREGLLLLARVQFRSTWQFEEVAKKIPHVKSPRLAPLLAGSLAGHLSGSHVKIRDFSAYALSLWPEGAAMVSAELGHYIATAPSLMTADGHLPSDPRRLEDAARVLVANGSRSKAAALTIAPALLHPDRRELAERVIAAIGPDAAAPLSAAYLWQVARNGDPNDRGSLVAALAQVTSVSPAAEDLLLFVLLSGEPSKDLRIVATWGLRNATARQAEARQVLLNECRSPDADLVQHASSALIRVGMGETLPLDLPLTWLRGSDAAMRIKGAKLLATAGRRAADQAIPHLLRMADNVDPKQRLAAARALVAIEPEGKRLSPALLFSVYHADETMRQALLPAIRKVADPKVRSRLKDLSENEPDAVVRLAARQTLEELANAN